MIEKLVRENIKKLQPYKSARSLYTRSPYNRGLFLDANENSFGSVVDIAGADDLNRYPDPQSSDLRAGLSKYLAVPRKNIFAGSGSDEIIDLLIRIFVEPSEEILIVGPTYGVYSVFGETAGVTVKKIHLADYKFNAEKVISEVSPKTKIIFACSPNNPTGNLIPPAEIGKLCAGFNGIVVVDEAYVEFASSPSFAKLAAKTENLVVLRTFSKVWGLAGLRVGYAIASEDIINYLDKVKLPYNLNKVSARVALAALSQKKKMLKFKGEIISGREKLSKEFNKLGLTVYPSEANFLLVRFANGNSVFKQLVEDFGIIVRNWSGNPLLRNCLRITVGTPQQNKLLIKALSKIL